jgi:Ca2+-binding RTX toxin-like protein
VQDNNGAINDSVVDASVTYQTLINAIASAGGPTYQFRDVPPLDDTNGGEPGGNIRVGFLFNPNRVSFVDTPGGSPTTNTTVSNNGGNPVLSASPGLVDPTNPAFNDSRKPLVGQFTFNGESVFVIGNHFNSKGGDDPLFGPTQPPVLSSETQRLQQATIVKNFVESLLAVNPLANVVVTGDLNDFEFSNPVNLVESAGLTNLIETLPANERYSYNFQGNAQVLDHILASSNLASNMAEFDVVHINSEFADQISDHDPSVARFVVAQTVNGGNGSDTLTGNDNSQAFTGGQGRDFITTGGGNDVLIYKSIRDAGDIISDFSVGSDKINLSILLDSLGYTGTNPIGDGYVTFGTRANSTDAILFIDQDGLSGPRRPLAFLTTTGVSTNDLNNSSNFIF